MIEAAGNTFTFFDFNTGEPRHIEEKVIKVTFYHKIFNLRKFIFKPTSYLAYRAFRRQSKHYYKQYALPILGINANRNCDYNGDLMIIVSD